MSPCPFHIPFPQISLAILPAASVHFPHTLHPYPLLCLVGLTVSSARGASLSFAANLLSLLLVIRQPHSLRLGRLVYYHVWRLASGMDSLCRATACGLLDYKHVLVRSATSSHIALSLPLTQFSFFFCPLLVLHDRKKWLSILFFFSCFSVYPPTAQRVWQRPLDAVESCPFQSSYTPFPFSASHFSLLTSHQSPLAAMRRTSRCEIMN